MKFLTTDENDHINKVITALIAEGIKAEKGFKKSKVLAYRKFSKKCPKIFMAWIVDNN